MLIGSHYFVTVLTKFVTAQKKSGIGLATSFALANEPIVLIFQMGKLPCVNCGDSGQKRFSDTHVQSPFLMEEVVDEGY